MIYLIAGSYGESLANQMCNSRSIELIDRKIKEFPDGERYFRFGLLPNLDAPIYIVQSMMYPQEANLFELLNIAYNLKLKGHNNVNAICPYFAYARSDREVISGDAISSLTVLSLLESVGIQNLIVVDLHNPEILLNSKTMQVKNIIPAKSIKNYLVKHVQFEKELTIVAPDIGALTRAKVLASEFKCDFTYLQKQRDPDTGKIESSVPDDFSCHSTAIIVDDILSSGGSMLNAIRLLKIYGVETIHVVISHVMGTTAVEQLQELGGGIVVATESIYTPISNITLGEEISEVILSDIM